MRKIREDDDDEGGGEEVSWRWDERGAKGELKRSGEEEAAEEAEDGDEDVLPWVWV